MMLPPSQQGQAQQSQSQSLSQQGTAFAQSSMPLPISTAPVSEEKDKKKSKKKDKEKEKEKEREKERDIEAALSERERDRDPSAPRQPRKLQKKARPSSRAGTHANEMGIGGVAMGIGRSSSPSSSSLPQPVTAAGAQPLFSSSTSPYIRSANPYPPFAQAHYQQPLYNPYQNQSQQSQQLNSQAQYSPAAPVVRQQHASAHPSSQGAQQMYNQQYQPAQQRGQETARDLDDIPLYASTGITSGASVKRRSTLPSPGSRANGNGLGASTGPGGSGRMQDQQGRLGAASSGGGSGAGLAHRSSVGVFSLLRGLS